MRNVTSACLLAALVALSSACHLEQAWGGTPVGKPKLTITVKSDKSEKDRVKPGDVVTYTITCSNRGEGPAKNAEVVNPIPRHAVCVPESASGKGTKVLFSINGGKSYAPWPIRVRDEKTKKEKPVTPDQVTHVKWVLSGLLQPGKEVIVKYHVRVK